MSDQMGRTKRCCPPTLGLTRVPKKLVPVSDLALPYLEYTSARANIGEDVFLVQLVDEGLFWGETEARVTLTHLFIMARSISSSHGHRTQRHLPQNGSLNIP